MLPSLFLGRMQEMLGSEYEAFLKKYEENHFQALRFNPLKGDTELLRQKISFGSERIAWEPNGFYYEETQQPGKSPYHQAGCYYIQEPSAMAPVHFLCPEPFEQILDLCAAPGGKTTQIASYMQGEGLLVSNEIHPARAKILSENVERMGVSNCLVTNMSPDKLAVHFPHHFQKILVDAPCSGEGMFRKNEDACDEWSLDHVTMCGNRQDEILEQAAAMLSKGGRIVYSTCTFAPYENEGSISRFLKKHPDFEVVSVEKTGGMINGNPLWGEFQQQELDRTVRLMPQHVRGEGHFLAVLQQEDVQEDFPMCEPKKASRYEKNGTRNRINLDAFWNFAQETLSQETITSLKNWKENRFLMFGEQLYLVPEGLPDLKGIKVIRPGLHLGALKKDRFEPSHALALAFGPAQVRFSNSFPEDSKEIQSFLKGETFWVEGEKGWHLICVDGFSLGWGKLTGNMMKNHYPKGLRR